MEPHSQVQPREDLRQDRRELLRRAGLAGLVLSIPGLATSCAKDAIGPAATASLAAAPGTQAIVTLDFATDVGVLNYAYALEQLEAAFYTQVIATPYAGMNASERRLLTDIRDHEIAHRDFFAAALGAAKIPDLSVDFSAVTFSSRSSVLKAAQTFEDLGVGAYNGAARYLSNDGFLLTAGKIVSVEARHASAIRSVREPRTGFFAPQAFDAAIAPLTVLRAADPFIVDTINAINT